MGVLFEVRVRLFLFGVLYLGPWLSETLVSGDDHRVHHDVPLHRETLEDGMAETERDDDDDDGGGGGDDDLEVNVTKVSL